MQYKENIQTLSADKALAALREPNPVTFNYKTEPEEKHAGFIAEEVPELVATKDRKGFSSMDIVQCLRGSLKNSRRRSRSNERSFRH